MKQICNNRFFAIFGKRRKASNEFTKHADAVKNFLNKISQKNQTIFSEVRKNKDLCTI